MRQKYNSIFDNSINAELSYIQKYMGSEIETLLNPEATSIHGVEFDSIYVRMSQTEKRLEPFKRKMESDRCVFLTGLTGCGKSSVLNYVFHTNINRKIQINDKSLYILFSFNHAMEARGKDEIKTYCINVVSEACEKIEDELKKYNIKPNITRFYKYIKDTRGDDLQHDITFKGIPHSERIERLRKKNPIEYCALRLKYLLTELKRIDHVVLIVDDIEAVGYQMELVPIDLGLTLWSCLKRQPTAMPKVWSSGVVISCRHYVYRMIEKRSIDAGYIVSSGITSQTLESYPIKDEINIAVTATLNDIIKKRVPALKAIKSDKRWDDAWKVVDLILSKVDDQFGEFILAMCISDIRKSLSILKKVVLNKRWIQRYWQEEETSPGAFYIDSIKQFNLSPPCLLRAIALGEGNIYTDDSILPNILHNTPDEQSDLISLITLKAFLHQSRENRISWRTSIDRDQTTERLKKILPIEVHPYVDSSINFLIINRLLLRSKNQAQDDGIDIDAENVKSIKYVYVSKGAFSLWNQLGRSSVLLELFSDDLYIERESAYPERQNFSLFDQETFRRCIDFITKMVEVENNLRLVAHNRGHFRELNSLIGKDFVTKQLLEGLIASRNAYFKSTDDFRAELNSLLQSIDIKQRLIDDAVN